jgi:DnaJ-class molecular chaperone
MAAEETETAAPRPCPPCRGTGRVISNLGGTSHGLPCPWCDGTGTEIPGRNAQEHAGEGERSAAAA